MLTVGAIFLTFRSWRKTLLSMIAMLISVLWTLGLYSLMGFTYNVLSSMILPLIVVLAIADDVHMMQHWDEERRLGDNEHAFKATVAHLAAPLLGASATTALGMLSLATSNVVAVRAFGDRLGSRHHDGLHHLPDPGADAVDVGGPETTRGARTSVPDRAASACGPLFVRAPWSRRCRLTAHWFCRDLGDSPPARGYESHQFFPGKPSDESSRLSVIDKELSGVYSFQIMLEGPPDSLKTPDALHRIDRLEQSLRAFPHVRKVTSVADYVKRINQELNDGQP